MYDGAEKTALSVRRRGWGHDSKYGDREQNGACFEIKRNLPHGLALVKSVGDRGTFAPITSRRTKGCSVR
jgi:hypothetical protein